MPNNYAYVLDASGSMSLLIEATLEGFNAYLEGLQKTDPDADFTLVTFGGDMITKIHVRKNVLEVPKLTRQSYIVGGATPLRDACGSTILAVEQGQQSGGRTVIAFHTDGHENNSREFTHEALVGLINRKKNDGWQFLFMGAGLDGFAQSSEMGITAGRTISYNAKDIAATRAAFMATAANASAYAMTGDEKSILYSAKQRADSGDIFHAEGGDLAVGASPVVEVEQ